MFQSSKTALAFAGVTLFGAAIFAGSMGDSGPGAFVAPAEERDRDVADDDSEQAAEPVASQETVFEDYAPADDFGDMAFAEDEALIDDASGFDPSGFGTEPNGQTAIITPSKPSGGGRGPGGGPGSGVGPPKVSGSISRGGGASGPAKSPASAQPRIRPPKPDNSIRPKLKSIGAEVE